jgi:RNA polymerase sigma-70 factor (ECF subfamily)
LIDGEFYRIGCNPSKSRGKVTNGEDMDHTEEYVQQLAENQARLYGYVYSLLGDHSRAADVVQETNLVLWRKLKEFDAEREFLPWAFAIARFQVMAHLRDRKRDRLLLDAELAELLSAETQRQAEHVDAVRSALRACVALLTPENRSLIEHRYVRSVSIAEVALRVERTVGAIKVALLRIRRQLANCVQKRIAAEG